MQVEQFSPAVLAAAVVLLVAVAAVRLSVRTGLPSLLIYVALGVALGEDGLGIRFDDDAAVQLLGYAALVVILAEGGLTTSWAAIRPAVPAAAVLATVGSIVSVVVTAAAGHLLLGWDWPFALLVGAVLASTDAAAVFSVLRRVPLPRRTRGLLEAESGFNDAPVVILVVTFAETLGRPDGELEALPIAAALVLQLAIGLVVGIGTGWVGAVVMRRIALPSSGLYPLAVLAHGVAAYGAAGALHGSGFLAVYVASLVLGNARLPHGPATRGFAEGLAWLAQIGLFVMLGLRVIPHELGPAVLPALLVGLVLLLVARPLSVLVSVTPFRVPLREQAFLSWAGLRGAVPIVLATVPLVEGIERAGLVFDLVFVLVIVFTLVQAPTLPAVGRRLGLLHADDAVELEVETSPLAHLGAELLEVRVPEGSNLHGVELFELRLPKGAVVTLVVRDSTALVPTPTTRLQHGDEVLVVTTAEARPGTEARLRAVSRGGRLAGWQDGRGEAR